MIPDHDSLAFDHACAQKITFVHNVRPLALYVMILSTDHLH